MTIEQHPETPTTDESTVPERTRGVLPTLLLVGILLTTLIASGYSIVRTHALELNMQHIKRASSQKDQQLETLQIKIQDLRHSQDALHTQMNQMSGSLQQALDQHLYQNQDWLLLKARYYLELANIDTQWTEHYESSVQLLQQADMLIKTIANPKLLEVRQAIAKHISDIKALPDLDVAGILSQLVAVQEQIHHLKARPLSLTMPKSEIHTEKQNPSAWNAAWQKSLAALQRMIIIRHHDMNIKPMLSPIYQASVKENIYMQLQQAQWAVIHKNQAIYDISLKQAIANVQQHFDDKALSTANVINQLDTLTQITLNAPKPETGKALVLLNQVIDQNQSTVKPPKGM